MTRQCFEGVPYLRACGEADPAFLDHLVRKLTFVGFAPKEAIHGNQILNIVRRGVVARDGQIFSVGNHWGEDMILCAQPLRDGRPVQTLMFCEVARLTRTDLEDTLPGFPNALRTIRLAAVRLAIRRAFMDINASTPAERSEATDGSSGSNANGHPPLDPPSPSGGDSASPKHRTKHPSRFARLMSNEMLQRVTGRSTNIIITDPGLSGGQRISSLSDTQAELQRKRERRAQERQDALAKEVHGDVATLRSDMASLRADVSRLEGGVAKMREDMLAQMRSLAAALNVKPASSPSRGGTLSF